MIPPTELSILLPCGHYIAQAELLRLAASIMGQRGKGKSGGARKGSGRLPKGTIRQRRDENFYAAIERASGIRATTILDRENVAWKLREDGFWSKV